MTARLALDLDGVLCDSLSLYKKIASEEGVKKDIGSEYNGIWKAYTASGENFGKVLFGKHGRRVIDEVEPYPNALDNYGKFIEHDKIQVYIVTARNPEYKKQTEKWLSDNGFTGFEDLLFLKDKTKAPCNTIVDDAPRNVSSYIDNARLGYIIDRPYNREFKRGRRMKNLNEVYKNLIQIYE